MHIHISPYLLPLRLPPTLPIPPIPRWGKNEGKVGDVLSFSSGIFCLPPHILSEPYPGSGRFICMDHIKGQPALCFWLASPDGSPGEWRKEGLCPERSPWAGCTLPPKALAPIRGLHTGSQDWEMLPPPRAAGPAMIAEPAVTSPGSELCLVCFPPSFSGGCHCHPCMVGSHPVIWGVTRSSHKTLGVFVFLFLTYFTLYDSL